jgi:hypothetical protein
MVLPLVLAVALGAAGQPGGGAMTDLLSQLRLTSGLPFGMLIMLAGLGGMTIIGLVLVFRLRKRRLRVAALLLAMAAGGRLALGIASEVLIEEDLNPAVREGDLVGSWRDGAQALALHPDLTFQLVGPTSRTGTWELHDQELSLGGVNARVIKVNGLYRIVPSFPEDPDLWDGRLGYAREAAR